MRDARDSKIKERRKKRMVIPIIYFLAETTLAWLILSLIQVNFNISHWAIWSMVILALSVSYSISKTVHVYKRQRDYPKD